MTINESILGSTKKLLGITEDYTHFDPDLVIFINSVFSTLNQIALDKEFYITGDSELWLDYVETEEDAELLKNYMYLKVRLVFDPPQNSSVLESIKSMISELEFRIAVRFDKWKWLDELTEKDTSLRYGEED